MHITSSAIQQGVFADKYGKRGTEFSPNGMPTHSIPFEIHQAPEGTKSFAVVLEDKDAITASGFVWIHWLIANLERTSVKEKAKAQRISCKVRILGRVYWVNLILKKPLFTVVWHHRIVAIVMN